MCFGTIDAHGSETSGTDMNGNAFLEKCIYGPALNQALAVAHIASLSLEEGRVQMANISLQGHPSLLMQGFLWV